MSASSLILLPILLVQLLASPAPRAGVARFTPPDTSVAWADTVPALEATVDFGAELGPPVAAQSFELTMTAAPGPRSGRKAAATTRLRFVRPPDALSGGLALRVASGDPFARVEAQLPGAAGGAVILHLHDVRVVSTRLVLSDDSSGLEQRRLALVESIAQISADLQEAQRQLVATESLAKQRLSPSIELARARSRADVLARRLAVQERRLTLVEREYARWTPTQEEIVLSAVRAELETR